MQFGFRKPKKQIPGAEFSGKIEATGKNVTRFKEGDAIFGYSGSDLGAYAGYLCMPESGTVAFKPANMSYEEAATILYGALTAFNLLSKVNIRSGQKVLVIGASGGIGSAAVQLARYFGAEVTGVCSTPGFKYIESLGAHKVINYTKEVFTGSGETYDLIFDIIGKSTFSKCKSVLKENERYLLASFKMKQVFQMLWTSMTGSKKVICALSLEKPEDLYYIKGVIEAGKLRSVIDKRYSLEQAAEAHRYYESGHKQGSIVLNVE